MEPVLALLARASIRNWNELVQVAESLGWTRDKATWRHFRRVATTVKTGVVVPELEFISYQAEEVPVGVVRVQVEEVEDVQADVDMDVQADVREENMNDGDSGEDEQNDGEDADNGEDAEDERAEEEDRPIDDLYEMEARLLSMQTRLKDSPHWKEYLYRAIALTVDFEPFL